MEKKTILILAYARTGSNYFCGLLNKTFKDINANYEIFHESESHINSKYLKEMYLKYYKNNNLNDYDDSNLVWEQDLAKVSKQNPIKFLENLTDISKECIVTFKVFTDHLDDDNLKQIINKSDMIIVLNRKFIDIFISNQKAMMNNDYCQIDTTKTKILFDVKRYEFEKEKHNKWYSKINDLLNQLNRDCIKIDYDNFHKKTLKQQQEYLKENINIYLQYDLDINYDITTLNKQDKSTNYSDKIINYDTFVKYFNII